MVAPPSETKDPRVGHRVVSWPYLSTSKRGRGQTSPTTQRHGLPMPRRLDAPASDSRWLHIRRHPAVFCNRHPAASGIGQRYRQFCILSKILCAMRYVRDPVQGRNRPRRMRRCRALPSTPSRHEHLHPPMHVRGLSQGLGVSVKASRERSRFDRIP